MSPKAPHHDPTPNSRACSFRDIEGTTRDGDGQTMDSDDDDDSYLRYDLLHHEVLIHPRSGARRSQIRNDPGGSAPDPEFVASSTPQGQGQEWQSRVFRNPRIGIISHQELHTIWGGNLHIRQPIQDDVEVRHQPAVTSVQNIGKGEPLDSPTQIQQSSGADVPSSISDPIATAPIPNSLEDPWDTHASEIESRAGQLTDFDPALDLSELASEVSVSRDPTSRLVIAIDYGTTYTGKNYAWAEVNHLYLIEGLLLH